MDALKEALSFLESARAAARARAADFDEVATFFLFVGYPRSGHSLVGSLLDAHPDIVVGHELNALRCVDLGMDRLTLFHLLDASSRAFSERGRAWAGYDYRVPDSFQGRFRTVRAIGDKKGGGTVRRLLDDRGLVDVLHARVATRVRYIHVVRNPFDNIATLHRRHELPLDEAVTRYFALADGVEALAARVGDAIFDVHHEAFVGDPRAHLTALCAWLGVGVEPDHLDRCARIVFAAPKVTRGHAAWSRAAKRRVEEEIARRPLLRVYSR